jgi:rhomboid protease GluP
MNFEVHLVRTYLSGRKYGYGAIVAIALVSLCVVVSNFYWDQSSYLSGLLAASPELVFGKGEYWRLFTTTFAHADLGHLLSNSLMLFILTYFVTAFFGFWVSPVLSSIMGAVINGLVLLNFKQDITLVGISGVIYYLWGFWFVLYLFLDKKLSFIRRLINVMGIFLILLIPTSYSPQTSYLAHYLGFAVGAITALVYYPFHAKHFQRYQEYETRHVPDLEMEDQLVDEEIRTLH